MKSIEKIVKLATAEIGYMEKASNAQLDDKTGNAGQKNYTKYARDLDAVSFYNGKKNGFDWCTIFTDWPLMQLWGKDLAQKMTGQPATGSLGAGCGYAVGYFKKMGRFHSTPKVGDKIYFSWSQSTTSVDHVGWVVGVTDSTVTTIEGNTNGGVVARKSYNRNYKYIVGYGRPLWDLVEEKETEIIEDDEDMTQEKFNEMLSKAVNIGGTKDTNADYAETATEWAKEKGLFSGDGNGNFGWHKPITRQDMAVVLKSFWDEINR